MKRFVKSVDRMLAVLLVALMGIMVVTVTWQVATRYLLNSPSSYTEELATFLLIWISLLGAAFTLRKKAHLGVDALTRSFSVEKQRLTGYFGYGVVIAFSALVFVYGGLRLVYVTLHLEQVSAALQVPVGLVYLAIPLSGLLMIYYAMVEIAELRAGDDPHVTSQQESL